MAEAKYYLEIKEKKIPVILRNYKNSKTIRMFFKENILNISKPKYINEKEIMKMIKENEEKI